MKTNRIFIMALACVAAVSCAKEMDIPSAPSVSTNVFTAEKEEFEVPVKSALQGKKTVWEAGDEIAVHADGAAAVKFTSVSAGSPVEFSSETEVTGSSFLFAYPYSASKGVQDGKLLLTVPSEQTARTGSFDPSAALSAASATDPTQPVKFKNVLALLKFNIPAELDGKISSITVESKGGEALAGDILLNVADKTNEVSANGAKAITLSGNSMAQGYYYVAVRPCVHASGIKVTALFDDETVYTRESGTCEFSVNTIYDMGDVADELWEEAVAIEPSIVPSETSFNILGGGEATEKTLTVESNVEWKAVIPDDCKEWLSAEREGNNLKIKVTQNNRLSIRKGFLTLTSVEPVAGYEGVIVNVLQPIVYNIKVANPVVDESTGNVKLPLAKGQLATSYFKFAKGRLIVEFEDINASESAQFGFNFYGEASGNANFSFYLDLDGTAYNYMFRIGGTIGWNTTIKKSPSNYLPWSDIKKIEFICQDDPLNEGKLDVSILINNELYGNHPNRTDVFANGGDPQIYFHLQCKGTPASGDYCIVKSITYIPAE